MIREGLRKGVLDIHLPVACGGCHGLFIEFKAGRNHLTVEQENECYLLESGGYAVFVAWDTVKAIAATLEYLAGSIEPCRLVLK